MFDSLTQKLSQAMKALRGESKLTEGLHGLAELLGKAVEHGTSAGCSLPS